jgi:hypothetical protein
MYNDPDESIVVVAETGKPNAQPEDRYKVPTLEELKATLPCGDAEKVKQSQLALAEAYYKAGVIYKEKLDDADNATDVWEQQILNMEESDFHPMTLYQLYRTWLYKEQLAGYKANPFCETCSSVYWGNEVKSRYPDSEWARLIDNPEYLDQREVKDKEETAAYEEVYKLYVRGSYVDALGACNKVIQEEPENHLLCKYKLMRAICIGYSDGVVGVRDNFIKELNDVKANCPNSEEAAQASEILKSLNKELAPQNQGNNQNGEGINPPNSGEEGPKESVFKLDTGGEHYVAVVVPVKDFNMNNFKIKVTDYNTLNFATAGYKVTNNLLDKERHIIMVKPFQGADAAKDYMEYFSKDEGIKALLDGKAVDMFVISKTNYIALFKSKDLEGYLQFYSDNY